MRAGVAWLKRYAVIAARWVAWLKGYAVIAAGCGAAGVWGCGGVGVWGCGGVGLWGCGDNWQPGVTLRVMGVARCEHCPG
jgi:hypothetical protein